MDKLTFEERNLIIDQVIADLKNDHKNGLEISMCNSIGYVLECYGFYFISSKEEFDFLEIPTIKCIHTLWWDNRDLSSCIDFLKANKSAICQK